MPGSRSQRLASIAGLGPYSRPDPALCHANGTRRGGPVTGSAGIREDVAAPLGSNGDGGHRHPAAALLEEADAINEATGTTPRLSTSLVLAAWRGQEGRALQLIEASIQDATAENEGTATALAEYAQALLYNGLGRYQAALSAAERACQHDDVGPFDWALTELVEAGARGGSFEVAARALRRLEDRTAAGATDTALGVLARSRALLSDRKYAGVLHRQALEWLTSSGIALQLARARLLYGEWLRRESRRVDARDQLRAAHRTFNRLGANGFAERARRELLATGETVRQRTVETRDNLTAQERLVAVLAGDGRTNPEIGAELFISPRTVEWHLRKVFRKMDINSRKQLRRTAAGRGM
jgi:DNA-binding CsgD family transcriptional regulator